MATDISCLVGTDGYVWLAFVSAVVGALLLGFFLGFITAGFIIIKRSYGTTPQNRTEDSSSYQEGSSFWEGYP